MSSGDLLADRRFSFGEGLASDGDDRAAADLFEQALELVPGWAPAWLALGLARERLGDIPRAREAVERASALDPAGVLGADLHRARIDGVVVEAMPATFVQTLFDGYADRFDAHLSALNYRGPYLLAEALGRAGAGPFAAALDLGCGTGLMARQLRDRVRAIDGVDLSPRMIERARQSGLYRDLAVGGIEEVMAERLACRFDLVIAADVFVYVGKLDGLCHEAARILEPGGWLAFTVQSRSSGNFALGDDMRFSHSRGYIEAVLDGAGLDAIEIDEASTRDDRGVAVPGLVVVARKA